MAFQSFVNISFCGMGLSVIRSGLKRVLSIFSISPLSHLPFPSQPTTIELSNPSIPTKRLLSRSSTTPSSQIAKSHFTLPIVFLSSQQPLREYFPLHNSVTPHSPVHLFIHLSSSRYLPLLDNLCLSFSSSPLKGVPQSPIFLSLYSLLGWDHASPWF